MAGVPQVVSDPTTGEDLVKELEGAVRCTMWLAMWFDSETIFALICTHSCGRKAESYSRRGEAGAR